MRHRADRGWARRDAPASDRFAVHGGQQASARTVRATERSDRDIVTSRSLDGFSRCGRIFHATRLRAS
jgi:hypothetical protein